jgi:hypothetical protein
MPCIFLVGFEQDGPSLCFLFYHADDSREASGHRAEHMGCLLIPLSLQSAIRAEVVVLVQVEKGVCRENMPRPSVRN